MALSSVPCSSFALSPTQSFPSTIHKSSFPHANLCFSSPTSKSKSKNSPHFSPTPKWRSAVSFFPAFLGKPNDVASLKEELLRSIEPLDRGATASAQDQETVDKNARKLEAVNPTKEPLKSNLLNGKWELIYTTSRSILQTEDLQTKAMIG